MRFPTPRAVVAPVSAALLALWCWQPAAAQPAAEEPLITFDRTHPLLRDDGVPMLQLFASGRVIVTRELGRTRPGRYEFTVDDAELQRLVALAMQGADASPDTRAEPKRRVVQGQEVVTIVQDAPITTLRLRVAPGGGGAFKRAGASGKAPERVIRVEGLAARADDLERAPGIDGLISLEDSLLDVFDRAGTLEQRR